jgi:hypothetical protein
MLVSSRSVIMVVVFCSSVCLSACTATKRVVGDVFGSPSPHSSRTVRPRAAIKEEPSKEDANKEEARPTAQSGCQCNDETGLTATQKQELFTDYFRQRKMTPIPPNP